jgi:hypothetical protein
MLLAWNGDEVLAVLPDSVVLLYYLQSNGRIGLLWQIVIVIKSGGIRFEIRADHRLTQNVWVVPLKLSR